MPRLRLTDRHLDTLPAIDGRRTDYYDTLVPELVLRVTPRGKRSWAVSFHVGRGRAGRRHARVTLGTVKSIGLHRARQLARLEVETGGVATVTRDLTVEQLVARALGALKLTPKTRVEWERLAKVEIKPGLGSRPAAQVQRADIRAWAREIAKRSTATAQHAFEVLRRCYSWSVEDEELLQHSPCDRLRLGYAKKASDRVLSQDELRRLLGALARLEPEHQANAAATRLLLLTGVRREAVIGARRDERDGSLWIVPPERSKGGRSHAVPLSPAALAVWTAREAEVDAMLPGEQLLFPQARATAAPALEEWEASSGAAAVVVESEDDQVRAMTWRAKWVNLVRDEMRVVRDDWTIAPRDPRWRIHDLRHTLATTLTERLGVSFEVVSMILGHSFGPRVSRVYNRAERLDDRRVALERWAEWLERLKDQATDSRILAFRAIGGPPGGTHGPARPD